MLRRSRQIDPPKGKPFGLELGCGHKLWLRGNNS